MPLEYINVGVTHEAETCRDATLYSSVELLA